MPYEVFLHNVPKVSEDGEKAIPVPPCKTETFDDLEAAQKLAAEKKDEFERVVLISLADDKQRLVERYTDGQHEVKEVEEVEDEEKPVPA